MSSELVRLAIFARIENDKLPKQERGPKPNRHPITEPDYTSPPTPGPTPAPWVLDSDGMIKEVFDYAGCGSHSVEWANPHDVPLTLAAPAMFKALKAIRDALTPGHHLDPEHARGEALQLVNEAIASATYKGI